MFEPCKIKILYFDDNNLTMSSFIKLCGNKGNIEILGAFNSFTQIFPLLMKNQYEMITELNPDVLVIKVTDNTTDICPALRCIRKNQNVRLIGILCGSCADNQNLINSLDYHISSSDNNCIITDENIRSRVIYQIRTAMLMINVEKRGINNKWAMLPISPKSDVRNNRKYKIIAIGASAGGTNAVTEVLSQLPKDMPPILIVQHLPENFSNFFAKNLASRVSLNVIVAYGGEKLIGGNVYIAGNDKHLEIVRGEDGALYTKCTFSEKISGHRPSVDVLFSSVAKAVGAYAIGIILTGMGNDGAQGLLEMHEAGAYTIGQDKETCAVYGMPMVAFTLGAVTRQLPLGSVSKAIIKAVIPDEREEKQ